jgi:hypothetical protein
MLGQNPDDGVHAHRRIRVPVARTVALIPFHPAGWALSAMPGQVSRVYESRPGSGCDCRICLCDRGRSAALRRRLPHGPSFRNGAHGECGRVCVAHCLYGVAQQVIG